MRVIAGHYKGRQLQAPAGRSVRPTSDRVREALFSMLGDITGARVLDLFAGTGALAIEALSRGAASAVLVDRDRQALASVHANLKALGISTAQAQVRPVDALEAIDAASSRHETYDLLFIDPPYRCARLHNTPDPTMILSPLLAPAGRIVLESDRRAPLELALPVQRERRYGDTLIRIHTAQ